MTSGQATGQGKASHIAAAITSLTTFHLERANEPYMRWARRPLPHLEG
jgi:hypothetical protein